MKTNYERDQGEPDLDEVRSGLYADLRNKGVLDVQVRFRRGPRPTMVVDRYFECCVFEESFEYLLTSSSLQLVPIKIQFLHIVIFSNR